MKKPNNPYLHLTPSEAYDEYMKVLDAISEKKAKYRERNTESLTKFNTTLFGKHTTLTNEKEKKRCELIRDKYHSERDDIEKMEKDAIAPLKEKAAFLKEILSGMLKQNAQSDSDHASAGPKK